MMETMSRLWYAFSNRLNAAPLAAFMRLSAIDPDASTRKMMSAPDLRANFLARMSPFSTYTFLGTSPVAIARSRRAFW